MTSLLAGSAGVRQAAAAARPADRAAATIVVSAIGRCMATRSSGSERAAIKPRRRCSAQIPELPQLVLTFGGQLRRRQRGRRRVAVLVDPLPGEGAQALGDRRLARLEAHAVLAVRRA